MLDKKSTFFSVVQEDFSLVNQYIQQQLHSDVDLINQISQYIINSGGKRLRPLLVILTAKACQYHGDAHIPLAATIEFLHTATLLHDDVVDQSSLRRGKHTANSKWGNSPSVLVGDFLYSRAFQTMLKINNIEILNKLAHATNTIAEGEVMQIMNIKNINITEQKYIKVIQCKTAMLFEAACQTSAILAEQKSQTVETFAAYGRHLGLAFQIIDDLLDYKGDPNQMGKNIGDDLREGKVTLPIIYTLTQCNSTEREVLKNAITQTENNGHLIKNVFNIIERYNAYQYTEEYAKIETKKAIAQLDQLEPSIYKTAMEDIAKSAVSRFN